MEECVQGTENKIRIDNVEQGLVGIKSDIGLLFDKVEEVKEMMNKRLPIWTTFALSFLSGLVGWLGANCLHNILKG